MTVMPMQSDPFDTAGAAATAPPPARDVVAGVVANVPAEPVYMRTGFDNTKPIPIRVGGRQYQGSVLLTPMDMLLPNSVDYEKLVNTPFRYLGTPQYDILVNQLRAAGVLGRGAVSPGSVQNAWEAILGASQQQNVDPSSVMESAIITRPPEEPGGGMGPYRGGTQVAEYETVTVYDQNNVQEIADNAYSRFLGRKATKRERSALAAILNERPPQQTRQVSTTSQSMQPGADGYRTSSFMSQRSEVTPQVSTDVLAERQALRARDFPTRFAESVFMDELLGAMRSPI